MVDPAYLVLFFILMVMLFVWFGLCFWVFRRLNRQHPQKYTELGMPSLFRKDIQSTWFFLRFLWRKEYAALNDPSLSKACHFMRIHFVIYLVVFLALLSRFFVHMPRRAH